MIARRRLLAAAPWSLLVATGAAAAPKVHVVVLDKMAFGPAPPGLRVGDVIEWRNQDLFQHSATARDRSFDIVLRPGGRARVTLRKPGAVQVYCRYHPAMKLALSVAG
jgi:plastocyanin